MTDKNQQRDDLRLRGSDGFRGKDGFRGSENDALDRELDAALSQYAAVEPRSGLEERILANLQAEHAQIPEQAWWRWGVAVTVAVVVIVAVAFMWRPGRPTQQQIVQHRTIEQSLTKSARQAAANNKHSGVRNVITRTQRANSHHPQPTTVATATPDPKLDVFPAPQPLSREEITLARYVNDFPQEAVLIAQSQEEAEIEMQKKMGKTEPTSSDQQER